MLIYAGLYGIQQGLTLPEPADFNLYTAPAGVLARYHRLPTCLEEAMSAAWESKFVTQHLPPSVVAAYCRRRG